MSFLSHLHRMVRVTRRLDVVWAALRLSIFRHKPLVLFYCQQAGHRQTIHEVLKGLLDEHGDSYSWLVLNTFNGAGLTPELTLQGVKEFTRVNLGFLRLFRPAAFFTPYVGFKRPSNMAKVPIVHFLVSLTSLSGVYHETHFDDYDYIVCAGEHHVESFLEWRKGQPKLAGKVLIRGGYPKLDWTLKNARASSDENGRTIVYAPTHVYQVNERFASLRSHGAQIIRTLLAEGLHVIFRPHPESFRDADAGLVQQIVAEHRDNTRFEIDRDRDYLASYGASSQMVTDLSGTGFTYAFAFGRPVIFFAHDSKAEEGLEGIQFERREQIGLVARSIPELVSAVRELSQSQTEKRKQIELFRNQTVFNLGHSGKYLAQRLDVILAKNKCADWVVL